MVKGGGEKGGVEQLKPGRRGIPMQSPGAAAGGKPPVPKASPQFLPLPRSPLSPPMATPRKRVRATRKLRQWTVEQVESGKFPGLVWDDPPAKTMFRIPWKHAGKQEFRHDEDAGFFKAWAIFKGKYHPGEQLNPAAWKTRIRCALSKSPEFEEVPERSRLDSTEPYKVYRLVPISEQIVGCQSKAEKAKKAKLGRSKKNGGPPESIAQPSGSLSVLKMEENLGPEAMASHTPSALDSSAFQTGENSPQPGEPAELNKNVFLMNLDPVSLEGTDGMAIGLFSAPSPSLVKMEERTIAENEASISGIGSLDISRLGEYSISLSILYSGELMQQLWIPAGEFLITSVAAPQGAPTNTMRRVLLPSPTKIKSPQKQEIISRLLKNLERGVMAASNCEGIFVQCRGKASIFWQGPSEVLPPGRLENNAYLQLFSTRSYKAALDQFQLGLSPPPDRQITLCVGQELGEMDSIVSKPIVIQMEQIIPFQLLVPSAPPPVVEESSCLVPASNAILSANL
ncbi:interferon regulatory factor 9 isoform X2 [Sceloporus undulatus]|uniref:interferon regulatory factor 9 isoform X2 n=1 Tax=Sceloporus undulatus TaxID=8520 RepID=UPI001C4AC6A1|nr:interferon regulatory factor 9 isoform X2 [Sceloporus undulatus]